MRRSLQRMLRDNFLSGLVLEQVNRVCRMVPKQMVRPRTWFTKCIQITAAEEIGLHIHLLNRQVTGSDLLVHPPM